MRAPLVCAPEDYAALPDAPAVFLLWAAEGKPLLSRTAKLRRRLARLLAQRETPSRLLSLRGVARRIEYWRTASRLESAILYYRLAKLHFPEDYQKIVKLRRPAFVKLLLSNAFPRTQVTERLSGGRSLFYGPFPTKAAAERFEQEMLDLFQIRRCQENLDPSPAHPGCIYGEMNACLRPCQAAVSPEEYASEVHRVEQFLITAGRSLLDPIAHHRDRLSQEMNFEEAARQHKRFEKVQAVTALRGELASPGGKLSGVAVLPSSESNAVELQFLLDGCWIEPRTFSLVARDGMNLSMEARLRVVAAELQPQPGNREEHLALLVRWHSSSWRDGEWIGFELGAIPFRRLANAIARVVKGHAAPAKED
jgi:excinuclease UvrABC nuclease subunit